MIGETLGNYNIVAKLGEGGMGAVYLGHHPRIGRQVAIKVLRREVSDRPDVIARFFNEARTMAALRHPAFVDVFDLGEHRDGSAFIVMDFLEGEALGDRCRREKQFPVAVALAIARQITEGLAAAHVRGIIHRDLKPDNVFLVPDPERPGTDRVKLLDFGIAKLADAQTTNDGGTRTGVLLGTPMYMSPEQCRGGGAIDHRADLYSLGCILFVLLSGRPPFDSEYSGELIASHLAQVPPTLNDVMDPATPPPPAMSELVGRLLAKSPDQRPADAAAVLLEIDAIALNLDLRILQVPTSQSAPKQRAAPRATTPIPAIPEVPVGGTVLIPKTGEEAKPVTQGAQAKSKPVVTTLGSAAGDKKSNTESWDGFGKASTGRRAIVAAAIAACGVIAFIGLRGSNSSVAPAQPTPAGQPFAEQPKRPEPKLPEPAVVRTNTATVQGGSPVAGETAPTPSSANNPPVDGPAPEPVAERMITLRVSNVKPEAVVRVDGHRIQLPHKMPSDQGTHTLSVTTPGFKNETRRFRADADQAVNLQNKQLLFIE